MTDFLFPVPEVKSPRLLWLEKHNVRTKHYANRAQIEPLDEDMDSGQTLYPWESWVNSGKVYPRYGEACGGMTEQEAIQALAVKRGWLLWNEENAKP